MPTITVFPDVPRAYNRVEINWADTPAATHARVLRVDAETGECTPLRPYICFDGDQILLSCGHGIFWDTEVPLDRSVYYITESDTAPCIPDPDPCVPCVPVTAETEASTMPSNGAFRLKDPMRPCNDIYMPLCFDQATLASHRTTGQYCAPGTGVFFASMDTETYNSNALTVNPTNARRPIALTRQRRDVASNLTVVARTFTDRDNLLKLVNPGSPILLQGPPQYGIPDRYMDIGTVGIDRGLTDHKFQVRIAQMPHVAVDRPAGPQSGVCGSQVDDLCDFTFDELAADGNTWEDLIRGRPTGGVSGYRTWDDVEAEFADWDAVNDGTRTWYDLEVGN